MMFRVGEWAHENFGRGLKVESCIEIRVWEAPEVQKTHDPLHSSPRHAAQAGFGNGLGSRA